MSVTYIPDPRGTTWDRWVAELVLQLPRLPNPVPEKEWYRWAARADLETTLELLNPPDPRYFTSWRDWAAYLKQAVPVA